MENTPRKIVGMGIAIVFCVSFIIFGLNRFGRYLSGPSISSISLSEYTETTEGSILVEGTLQNTSGISINGKNIPITDALGFEKRVVIPVGHSFIEITVVDSFDAQRTYRYQVMNTAAAVSYPLTRKEASIDNEVQEEIAEPIIGELSEENLSTI
jgi:hypothetical protein